MNENIAKLIIDIFLLQRKFDDRLNELGLCITGEGEIGQIFLSLSDKTSDLLSTYMSLTDDCSYDSIADILQTETETNTIYHSLMELQEGQPSDTASLNTPPPYISSPS